MCSLPNSAKGSSPLRSARPYFAPGIKISFFSFSLKPYVSPTYIYRNTTETAVMPPKIKNVPCGDHAIKVSVVKLSTVCQKYKVNTQAARAESEQVSAA